MSNPIIQIPINNQGRRGYTLLFSILVTALVISIGVSILNIARKELVLAAGAKESQVAVYAADNGLECAVYWDGFGSFSTSTPSAGFVTCEGHLVPANMEYSTGASAATTTMSFIFEGGRCADVEVVKTYVSGYLTTTITSRGYNTGANPYDPSDLYNGDCSKTAPNKVERAIEFTY